MASGIWLVCSACDLRHSARPGGLCPRCGAPTAPPPSDAPGAAWRPLPPAPVLRAEAGGQTVGMRIAGGAFILGALLWLGAPVPDAAHASPAVFRIAAGLPVVVGIGLLLGREIARRTALAFVVLALAGVLVFAVVTHLLAIALFAAVWCGACLLLLAGRPSDGRLILGGFVLGSGLAAGCLVRSGTGPLATTFLQWKDEIGGEPVERLAGTAWGFQVPPQRWYASKRRFPVFEEDGSVRLECVLARPEGSAVLLLVSKRTPADRGFGVDTLADEISKEWTRRFQETSLQGVAPLPGRGGTRVLHMTARTNRGEFEALWGLYPDASALYGLMVGAPPRTFPALREELEGILASFQPDPLPQAPTDVRQALPEPGRPRPRSTPTYLEKAFSDIRPPRRAPVR